jgi:hypothetical protein
LRISWKVTSINQSLYTHKDKSFEPPYHWS